MNYPFSIAKKVYIYTHSCMWIFRRRYHKHVQQFKCQWGIHASLQNKVIPGHVEQSSISNPEKGRRKPHLFAFPFLLPPLRFHTWTSARDPACDHRRLAPHTLILDYFEGSLEACSICDFILHCITQTHSNYHIIQTVLRQTKRTKGNCTSKQCQFITTEFASFAKLENPLSGTNLVDFQQIHDVYGSMLKRLMSTCRKLKRKVKVINFCKMAMNHQR